MGVTVGAGVDLFVRFLEAESEDVPLASVGLRVSRSHDPGEIACYLQVCD